MSLPSPTEVGLDWLARMRWGAVLAETLAILVTHFGLGVPLRLLPLLALTSVTAVTNLAFVLRTRMGREPPEWVPGTLLALDTLTLTGLLYLAGGTTNPFSALYLVHVTLAAVLLGPRSTWSIVAIACASYGVLFLVDGVALPAIGESAAAMHGAHAGHAMHGSHAMHGGGTGYEAHLYGMFAAFTLSSILVAYFVTRVRDALRAREEELARVRELAARSEHLASLATLAAGAAHELGTPLATIAVVAKELERSLAALPDGDAMTEDARLVREEVTRCRTILDRMAARAGQAAGEAPTKVELRSLVEAMRASFATGLATRVDVDVAEATIEAPAHALSTIVENLVRNALDASNDTVHVRAEERGEALAIVVSDRGAGMDEATLVHATEPFFTTKEAGHGMGLGLFLANEIAARLGGTLALESKLGVGTTVTLLLPKNAATA